MKSLEAFLCLTALAMLPFVRSECFYFITGANQLRPGTNYNVGLTYLCYNQPNVSNVALQIAATVSGKASSNNNLQDSSTPKSYSASKNTIVKSGSTVLLPIPIGSNWKSGSYVINVNGTAGSLQFQRTINVGLNTKQSSLFIQTDKGIYQAGQTVKIRLISVDPELLPYPNKSFVLSIRDAQGNIIKQWNKIIPKTGIFESKLQLSTQPVLGTWSINAKLERQTENVNFIVQQYVLPRFQVTVEVPPYITSRTIKFPVSITAKYTYDQPVKGEYSLNVTQTSCTYTYSYCTSRPKFVTGEINGTATIIIRTGDLELGKDLEYGTSITVIGTVTEEFTEIQENDTETFSTYPKSQQLSVNVDSNFRPLLSLPIHIKLTHPDNTPVINPTGQGNVSFKFNNRLEPEVQSFTFDKNGVATVSITPSLDSQTLFITVKYKDLTGSASSNVAGSLSKKYLYINTSATKPKVGQSLTINVESSFPMTNFINYQVVGRGELLLGKTVPLLNSVTKTNFSFELTKDMAPSAAIAVFYVTSCGEIVGDAFSINVDGLFRTPLTLQLSGNETEPGDNVTITIHSDPNSIVSLLSVDQSVLLLSNGNDLTQSEVVNDLSGYGNQPTYSYFSPGIISRPGGIGSLDQIFQYSGLLLVTNGLYYQQQQCRFFGPVAFDKVAMAGEAAVASTPASNVATLVQPTTVRKYFPETWIFSTFETGDNGSYSLFLPVPDTITTWVITGFALNSKNGLGITNQPSNITVFKPFFLVANLPFSVIRGETIVIQVLVYNYLTNPLPQVKVTLKQDGIQQQQFTFVGSTNNATSSTKTISMAANDIQPVSFTISPNVVGYIPLKISAASTFAGDALVAQLNVKAEGAPQYFNKAVLVDLRNQTSFNTTIAITVPQNAVPGSTYIQFNGQGNIMASVISNLNGLIRLPVGCGEQNMVNFVPDIVVLLYLRDIQRYNADQINKIVNYLEIGYQTELTYKRNDGSFSAFGNVDNFGSTWLTAFVVKSFMMAQSYITIDDNVIAAAKKYLINSQASNGSFTEKGRVLDNIKGGSDTSPETLTSYVLISFLENPSKSDAVYAPNITKAVKFLESSTTNTNAYGITIVTYALQLAKSNKSDSFFKKMNDFAKTTGDVKYWHYNVPKRSGTDWWSFQALSYDVEATGYALLVYLLRGLQAIDQLPLVRWLVSQKNSFGGYSSTQDTVIGIQALGEAGPSFVGPVGSTVSLTIAYGTKTAKFNFDKQNELVIQQRQLLPNNISTVQITATGNKGVIITQVSYNYNVVTNTTANSIFTLEPKISPTTSGNGNGYILNICASYKRNDSTGMVLIQANALSGYIWQDLPAVGSPPELKRVDNENGNTMAVLYYSYIPSSPVETCVSLTSVQSTVVNDLKNANINIYRYYENGDQTMASYNLC